MIAFTLTALITLLGIRRYTRLCETPSYVLVPLFFAVYIPCSIVVLVPIDIVSSSKHSKSTASFYLPKEVRLALWRIIYWLAFILTWAILPMLQSYVDSGYRTKARKFQDAVSVNLKFQLAMLVTAVTGLAAYAFLSTTVLTYSSVEAIVMALSHSYALVIALWLMGHGLVNIPRRCWIEAAPAAKLKGLYLSATLANDTIADAHAEYANVAAEILALPQVYKEGRHRTWILELVETVEAGPGVPLNTDLRQAVASHSRRGRIDRSMINERYLARLLSRFQTARNLLIRYDADWQKLLWEASILEDITAPSLDATKPVFRYRRTLLPPPTARLYYTTVKPFLQRSLSVFLIILTVVLIWSELAQETIFSIVNFAVSHTFGLTQQCVSWLFLGYMCTAAFSSLTRIRVFQYYALVYRHTDYSSLLFYAMYACRLTVPLSYNYITLISSRGSVFEDFLGKSINFTPLGMYFNYWMPRFILVPIVVSFFQFYDRIFGLVEEDNRSRGSLIGDEEVSGYDSAYGEVDEDDAAEGRELINRALTDPSYRFALRHPNIFIVAAAAAEETADPNGSDAISNASAQSFNNCNGDAAGTKGRTSPTHLTRTSPSVRRTLQLGGGSVHRTRLHDQTALVGAGNSAGVLGHVVRKVVGKRRNPPNETTRLLS